MTQVSTWSRIGKDIAGAGTLDEALAAAGLDYKVGFRKVMANTPSLTVIQHRLATVRESDNRVYDVVSDRYRIVQNREAFDLLNYIPGIEYEKAGETYNGTVWLIGSLPECNVLGDSFKPYLIFRNGFTGNIKIEAAICPLRIVCQNQFNFAFGGAKSKVTIQHRGDVKHQLEIAAELLGKVADFMEETTRAAEHYAGIKLNGWELAMVMDRLFPLPAETAREAAKTKALEARTAFLKAYHADDNANFRGTGWGLINAYSDFITHRELVGHLESREDNRFVQTVFNPAAMAGIVDFINEKASAPAFAGR